MTRKVFLSSSYNNQKFIEDHQTVVKCTGDANAMVVPTVLVYYACTDLLIMLLYVWNSIIGDVSMSFEATKEHKRIKCDTGNTTECISDVRKHLFLVHAFDECNTTSTAYEHGKFSVLKLFEKFKTAREEAHAFLQ